MRIKAGVAVAQDVIMGLGSGMAGDTYSKVMVPEFPEPFPIEIYDRGKKIEHLPPIYDLYKDGVTQGLLSRFLLCPEKHRLGSIEGLRQIRVGGPLAFGSLVHDVLDHVYSTIYFSLENNLKFTIDDIHAWIKDLLEEFLGRDRSVLETSLALTPQNEQQLEMNYGMADVMLRHYFKRWRADRQMDWVSLEENFRVMLDPSEYLNLYGLPEIPIRGKMDGVFRSNEKLWLFETKTKARIEEESIVDTLGFNLQVCMYLWAIKQIHGERPAGVKYNLIRKPQIRMGKTESIRAFFHRMEEDVQARPDFYFVRYDAVIMPEEMQLWEEDFKGMLRSLIEWHEGKWHYRNPCSCVGQFGRCEFLPICSNGDRSGFVRLETIFPELEPDMRYAE